MPLIQLEVTSPLPVPNLLDVVLYVEYNGRIRSRLRCRAYESALQFTFTAESSGRMWTLFHGQIRRKGFTLAFSHMGQL